MDIGCFHILTVVNSAAVNIGVHVSFWIMFFFFSGYMPRVGLQGHMVALFLVFKGTSILFSALTKRFSFDPKDCGRLGD